MWLRAAWNEYTRDQSYRVYLTDAAKILIDNTAHIGGGTVLNARWVETLNGKRQQDNRSAEEIIADVVNKAGITVT